MTPDVNVLVAAFRSDHSHHDIARRWLSRAREDSADGVASLTLLLVVMIGFVRLVTNTRVFAQPDTVEDAIAFLDTVLDAPGATLAESASEWPMLRVMLLAKNLHGNAVTDAWIATAAQARGEHLVTFDRDFRRLLSPRDVTVLENAR